MSARSVFLDTNGWLALLSSSDALHSLAKTIWAQLIGDGCSFFLTDWIVAETGNGLARTRARAGFVEAVHLLRGSSRTRVVAVTPALMNRALALYQERSDKTWGLVDCCSLLVMQDEDLFVAFTTDRHFEQAGYKCLLPIL